MNIAMLNKLITEILHGLQFVISERDGDGDNTLINQNDYTDKQINVDVKKIKHDTNQNIQLTFFLNHKDVAKGEENKIIVFMDLTDQEKETKENGAKDVKKINGFLFLVIKSEDEFELDVYNWDK